MNNIYKSIPSDKIPWNIETPPPLLSEVYNSGLVKPCKAADFGCGLGHNAIYFASNGFNMTGFDISSVAVRMAKRNAAAKQIKCNFVSIDLLGNLKNIKPELTNFDFAYDYEVMHHIYPDQRDKYVKNVYNLLSPKANYLSVCFSEYDNSFGSSAKYRKTKLGTLLYFSSENELKALFSQYFNIIKLKSIKITGKNNTTHVVCYSFLERK